MLLRIRLLLISLSPIRSRSKAQPALVHNFVHDIAIVPEMPPNYNNKKEAIGLFRIQKLHVCL